MGGELQLTPANNQLSDPMGPSQCAEAASCPIRVPEELSVAAAKAEWLLIVVVQEGGYEIESYHLCFIFT